MPDGEIAKEKESERILQRKLPVWVKTRNCGPALHLLKAPSADVLLTLAHVPNSGKPNCRLNATPKLQNGKNESFSLRVYRRAVPQLVQADEKGRNRFPKINLRPALLLM